MACTPPTITVGGVTISTDNFTNAQELLTVSGDQGDPTADADDENIANGNNAGGTTGVQFPPPEQETPPGPITQEPSETKDSQAKGGNGTPVICSLWAGDYNYQLSPNFQVKDFSITAFYPNRIIDFTSVYGSVTASERVCNLQALAVNIAEPLRAKFGPFRINSGIRNDNTTKNGLSQHVSGEAMDVQFVGWTYARYWENAQWIVNNLPFDQFIFEHSDRTGLAWYHLSFRRTGNRSVTDPRKVMTMYRNNYSPGLRRYG